MKSGLGYRQDHSKTSSSVGNSLTSPSGSSPPVGPLDLITVPVRHTLYRRLLYSTVFGFAPGALHTYKARVRSHKTESRTAVPEDWTESVSREMTARIYGRVNRRTVLRGGSQKWKPPERTSKQTQSRCVAILVTYCIVSPSVNHCQQRN